MFVYDKFLINQYSIQVNEIISGVFNLDCKWKLRVTTDALTKIPIAN